MPGEVSSRARGDLGRVDTVSPEPLADDLRSADDRDFPSRTDVLGSQLSEVIGGPVGRHALVGRQPFWTPLRVVLIIALGFLMLGWTSKAPCLQQTDKGNGAERVARWDNHRQYLQLCYSDTVPLYGAELLNQGYFPYKSSWLETDESGHVKVQYDGTPAVRYMEYPVVTGLYQYGAMALAKTYTKASDAWGLPIVAEVVMFFDVVAFGLALAWLVTIWASAGLSPRTRPWDVVTIAVSPIVIFQIFTNFDALATAFGMCALLAWARRKPGWAGALIGLGVAAKLYPVLFLVSLLLVCLRAGRLREFAKTAAVAVATWVAVNAPVALLFPRGWMEFFRLNTRRGDDMDSLYNVVKSFTGWRGFDGNLGFWEPPVILNAVSAVVFCLCALAIGYVALTAPRRPRVMQLVFLVVAAFLLTNKVWSPQYSLWLVPLAALALPHRRLLLAWMTVDALVWIPRMYYLLGIENKGLPQEWFTGTVLVRDALVVVLCLLVLRQIYHPSEDLIRVGGVDDPAGGPCDGAADAPVAWLPGWLRPRRPAPHLARKPKPVA